MRGAKLTTKTLTWGNYKMPVYELIEPEPKEPGKLTCDNLLLSGDFPHRLTARARFTITPEGRLEHRRT